VVVVLYSYFLLGLQNVPFPRGLPDKIMLSNTFTHDSPPKRLVRKNNLLSHSITYVNKVSTRFKLVSKEKFLA
jgi:hypothetical protein